MAPLTDDSGKLEKRTTPGRVSHGALFQHSPGLHRQPQSRVRYLLHVGIAHGLGDALAFIVAGSGSYGIHVAPVILGLRVDFRVCGGGGTIRKCFQSLPLFTFIHFTNSGY